MMPPSALMTIAKLSVVKDGRTILSDLGFTIPAAALTILVGPNGAGKSTLLRCMAGLEKGHLGNIWLQGQSLHEIPPSERSRRLSWLPPSSHLPFNFDVQSVVTLGRYPWHQGRIGPKDRERALEALLAVGLAHAASQSFPTLSSGEAQKAMVARALAGDADLLLLDEPCANLDLAAALSILALLKKQTTAGKTIVMTLHDLSLATRFADFALILQKGKLVAAGTDALSRAHLESVFGIRAEPVVAPSQTKGWVFSPQS